MTDSVLTNDPALWLDRFPRPAAGGHKYDRGAVLVLGGDRLTGAARLAAAAAMRIGAGLCTIAAPAGALRVYQTGPAHIMAAVADDADAFLALAADARFTAFVIGPGAGLDRADDLRTLVTGVCALSGRGGLVLDADALTAFAGRTDELFHVTHGQCVLTPHEGEFARLFPDIQGTRIDRARVAAGRSRAVILLKGPDTVIAAPDGRVVVNTHASARLATAGTGDVLAGLTGGLLAQGVEGFDAACMAAWVHGEGALRFGPGLVAGDLVDQIPGILADWA